MPNMKGMPGMPMGTGSAAHHVHRVDQVVSSRSAMSGMAMTHGAHAAVPVWLGIAAASAFVLIAVSHLRHLVKTADERRSWHACHVLIATGMVFMYASASVGSLGVPAAFWRLAFAAAGVLAALWALGGTSRAPSPLWLLTAVDLGAMFYMWSAHPFLAPLSWLLVAYFVLAAAMWALDAFRQLDGGGPSISWRMVPGESGSGAVTVPMRAVATAASSLIGELDIGVSMFAMALGMAYMLAVMQTMV
ncbi:MAG TPA: DUF5134 domain-containing protein [Solirubrobacteraceae bacterium]|nr:DUF5134 domain-containing protein [Solirubrobacteraceae bacterium]